MFRQLLTDPCVFIFVWEDGRVVIIVLYVDDMVLAGTRMEDIMQVVTIIESKFKITQRPLEFVLGVKVSDSRGVDGCIRLDLNAYTRMVLDRHADLLRSLPKRQVSTPLAYGTKLSKAMSPQTEEDRLYMKDKPYRSIIGELMYLANGIRLDITFAVNYCARYMADPGRQHWEALLHILRYLACHPDVPAPSQLPIRLR